MKRDLLSIADLTPQEITDVLDHAEELKQQGTPSEALVNRTVALLFEKPSLRTRVSFDVAVHQLGGHCLYLGKDEVGLGVREPVSDVAKVISRYVDMIVARTYAHSTLEQLASFASAPVVNALSDEEHPCQILADLLTIREKKGRLQGLTIAYIGDGNNVARSLALGAASVGATFHIASPNGYGLPDAVVGLAGKRAQHGARLMGTVSPQEAMRDADVVYTDVWVSMGQEDESQRRKAAFMGFQVTPQLLSLARKDAILMHPMPAHYGEEVPPGMLECPQSVAYDQAENRLHAQKAVLAMLAKG